LHVALHLLQRQASYAPKNSASDRTDTKKQDVSISILATFMMLLALIGNIDPRATGVNQFLPHMFLVLVLAGAIWYLYLKVFSPGTIMLMTNDMEAIRATFLQDEANH
jgi:hypothetical protein